MTNKQPPVDVIKNVNIPCFSDMTIGRGMDVFLKNGLVEKVVPADAGVPAFEGTSCERVSRPEGGKPGIIIDGRGMVLIPGMVNLHAHTAMTLLRGTAEDVNAVDWFNKHIWIYEQGLKPEDVYTGTLLGGAEMLLNGVTAVADHYFAMDQAWRAYDELGMRADLSWALFGLGEGVEENLNSALEFNRRYRDKNPLITVSMGPHSPYLCPDDFLRRTADIAKDENLKLHIHAAEDERQIRISAEERGKTPIEVLEKTGVLGPAGEDGPETILAHAYYASDEDLRIMAGSRCRTAHCPKTYLRFGDSHDFLPRALNAGAALALGTDGAASNSTMNIAEAARLAALMGKSSTENAGAAALSEVLPLMFSGGRALGLPRYGNVVPGAPADLVLLDLCTPEMIPGNNIFADILYGLDGRNVHTVIVDGRPLVSAGRLLTADFTGLRKEASAIARRLVSTTADSPMQEYQD